MNDSEHVHVAALEAEIQSLRMFKAAAIAAVSLSAPDLTEAIAVARAAAAAHDYRNPTLENTIEFFARRVSPARFLLILKVLATGPTIEEGFPVLKETCYRVSRRDRLLDGLISSTEAEDCLDDALAAFEEENTA